ncbi:hypothetical protein JCM11251_005804 [Rhodosporidiobolus azoricus]
MPRFAPYHDPTAPPIAPARWTRPGALQSTSKHNSTSPLVGGVVGTGKHKARASASARAAPRPRKLWKGPDALLAQSFALHRLSPLSSPPFSSSSSSTDFRRFAAALRTFLRQQLALGLGAEDLRSSDVLVERVEVGFVDLQMFGKEGGTVRPVLLEVDRGEDALASEASTSRIPPSRISTFVFLPSSTAASDHLYPLLLSKSPDLSISNLVNRFLTTRHNAILLPFRISPPAMIDLLENIVQNRDADFDEVDLEAGEAETLKGLSTTATFAFPVDVAKDGLNSLTLTLPPAILPFLCRPSSPSSPNPSSTFASALSRHLHSLTSLSLSSLFLVRFGAGRGTFIHSGQGQGQGEGGAKVKFFRGAEEGEEVKRVCEGLVRAAEVGRRALRTDVPLPIQSLDQEAGERGRKLRTVVVEAVEFRLLGTRCRNGSGGTADSAFGSDGTAGSAFGSGGGFGAFAPKPAATPAAAPATSPFGASAPPAAPTAPTTSAFGSGEFGAF